MKPLCFVIMPFGVKKFKVKGEQEKWVSINFDDVYNKVICSAIKDAGMEPIRADKEKTRGIIHKPMFERIILSDYVVADLTGANANVFYEIGIRHAVKPYTTISIFATNSELPFDLAPFKAFPYEFSEDEGILMLDSIKKMITTNLIDAKKNKFTDSPIYQLVDGINFQNSLAHEKTDIFRDVVKYNDELREDLKIVRQTTGKKINKIKALRQLLNDKFSPIEDQEGGILIDIMLTYRDIEDYVGMEKFIKILPIHIQQTTMVQEQYGFVLNRNKKREKAIEILEKVIHNHGPSSETYGILGRVHKDYAIEYYEKGEIDSAIAYIDNAMDAYRKGFEVDWRDAYPGINYLTCLELKGLRELIKDIIPVVEYSVLRKKEKKKPDYWDEATLLELAVINSDIDKAKTFLIKAKMTNPSEWMLKSTNNNLMMIRYFRKMRNENTDKLDKLIECLPKP